MELNETLSYLLTAVVGGLAVAVALMLLATLRPLYDKYFGWQPEDLERIRRQADASIIWYYFDGKWRAYRRSPADDREHL